MDPQVTPQLVKSLQSLKKSKISPDSVKKLMLNFNSCDDSISHNLDETGMHLDDWPVQRFGSQLKYLECLHVDYCLDEYDVSFGCMPALETKNGLDFTLPLLQGLQSCANLKYLKFNFNRNFENMGFDNQVTTCLPPLGTFMENIATNCQKISTLELATKHEGGIYLEWITWILKFQNLETMIVNARMVTVAELEDGNESDSDVIWSSDSQNYRETFPAKFKDIFNAFFQNPLVYLKDLIMTEVTLFLNKEFLSRILEAFPSLENYVLNNRGNPYVKGLMFGTKNLVAVLQSLCRIKRVAISRLVLVLTQYDDLDSAQTKVIFETACNIVNEKFDQKCGPLKIIDEKHGYVLWKNKEEKARIVKRQYVYEHKVVKKSYNEMEEKIVLTLRGQEEPLHLSKGVFKSLIALLPQYYYRLTEYQDFNDAHGENKEEEARIIKTQEVNGYKVVKKTYNKMEEKFVLTLEGQKERLYLSRPVLDSLVDLLPEYQGIESYLNFTKYKFKNFKKFQPDVKADEEPDEYLDALMFHVMSDPVRLPDSGKIVDRSTIARHFLSDQNDPFTRAPLSMEQVEPLDDLKMAIQAWMEEKRHQVN